MNRFQDRFLSRIRPAAAALALSLLAVSAHAQKKMKVFGFYPDFNLTPNLTDKQLDGLTHVIYFSIRMPSNGQVNDTYVAAQINGQKLIDIVYRAKDKNVKTLLGVGGWELSNEFAGVAGNASLRSAFATSAAKFCKDNMLAGMDIDWEFPTGNQANLAALLDAVNGTFKPAGLMVTLSVNGQAPDYYGASALGKVDNVLIMSYDNGTPHSTYDQAVQAMNAFSNQGVAKAKLILGVPFYGKSGAATKTYADLVKANPSLGAAVNDYQGYNFNGPDLITQKSGYVVDQSAGGMMIWQVSQDALTTAVPGGVLLAAMNKGFTNKGASLDKPVVSVARRTGRSGSLALRLEAGSLALPAGNLAPGSYRLTVFGADGETLANSLAVLPAGQNLLRWPGISAAPARAVYRIYGNSRLVSAGPVP